MSEALRVNDKYYIKCSEVPTYALKISNNFPRSNPRNPYSLIAITLETLK